MKISEKERKELAIRRHEEALRRNQYSLATTTNGNNNIWKLAIIILGGGAVLASLCGIAYLIGQNSTRYNKCKC